MAFGFVKKTTNGLCKLFKQQKPEGNSKLNPRRNRFPVTSPSEVREGFAAPHSLVQAHRLLFEINCPPRRSPHRRRHPDIRCMPVKNFAEAYRFFIRLFDQRYLSIRQSAGILHYQMQLSDGTVIFDLTDKVTGKPPGTVAVLKINKILYGMQLAEIEFIQSQK